ncbi:macro domain-containing protein [Flectobacillus sp. DC10W]|uniref:Macro domain-containing protein n=1 Tax=Flectobacillus longus TaxID=2984207 RepID=A0ABT6YTN8_9BACT|nr:macro domain-containing protein [Flectobacillus longus]MDI9866954.1 macro domain-containing protein [Flectobacillus longus]
MSTSLTTSKVVPVKEPYTAMGNRFVHTGDGDMDGAVHRTGGKAILEECQKIRSKQGGCKVGEAVITTAGKLPAKFVIHTVGTVWNNGKNDENYNIYSDLLKQ